MLIFPHRFLLIYGNQQRKVQFQCNEPDGSHQVRVVDIKKKASEIFNLAVDHVQVKIWDRGFDDWIDGEDDNEEVEHNSKVQIALADMADAGSRPMDDIPTSVSLASCGTSSPTLCSSVNWVRDYRLPSFPASISTKLENGQALKEGERSAMLEAIYSSVRKYTYYPTSTQYSQIIQLLFDRFTKLAGQPDMSLDNARVLWKYRLQYKFANSRRREDSNVPVVLHRKRKSADNQPTAVQSTKKTPPQWGIANYQPARPSSEDDASIAAHIKWMKQETSKRKPDCDRIKIAMSMTLADRRQQITKDGASIETIQKTYPWLFDEEEMQNEFKRLHEEGIKELLEAGLTKYGSAIIELSRNLKKEQPCLQEALSAIGLQREEKSRREATCTAAALGIPCLLKEQVKDMIVFGEEATDGVPIICGDEEDLASCSTFSVEIDGTIVSSSKDVLSAMAVYLASFYVFNLAYPTRLKRTLTFFQKGVLNIQDNLKPERVVISLLEKLSQLM
ncbi:sterile alpha motif domain-containing protein 3-like [Patiria miniata]|nr:sterile alpha motif domain-containing protein 3-like [Patiria miniata]